MLEITERLERYFYFVEVRIFGAKNESRLDKCSFFEVRNSKHGSNVVTGSMKMQSPQQCEETRHRWPLVKGFIFTFLWYFSIWAGFLYVCCPLWIFILVWPKLFLPVMSAAFSIWEMYPVALMNIIFGTQFRITGDHIETNEISLLLANHRTRVDWNFLWGLMYYASQPRNHRMKITLKAPLRNVPSLGWVMQVANCIYLARKWEKDESIMRRQLKFFRDTKIIYQMLFFPEGTDLTESNLRRSNEFAKKHNLQLFTHVLHPKTTGFVFLVDTMRSEQSNLNAIYDLTLAYSDFLPQTEMDILRGNFPKLVNFHITRYPIDSLPSDKADLQSWIQERWQEKENRLHSFQKERIFAGPGFTSNMETSLYLAFIVWTTLVLVMFYLFIASTFFFWWTIVHILMFVSVSYASLGYQTICVAVHEFWSKKEKIP